MSSVEELRRLGHEGERTFQSWLDAQGLAYVYVNQEPNTFACLFQDAGVKRPDFLVLLDCIGLLAVDVKNKKLSKGEFSLDLAKELRSGLGFERLFRIPLWYAYLNEGAQTWHWISALKAVEVGVPRGDFLAIRLDEFATVEINDDLGKLYSQRLWRRAPGDDRSLSRPPRDRGPTHSPRGRDRKS
jgi:hypothetical protein